jgi:acetaldehyde dehydrogenase/alcohol dehydrogenase
MPNITRAFIVTDPIILKLGYVEKLTYYLGKRPDHIHYEVFSEVESDPSVETIQRGWKL